MAESICSSARGLGTTPIKTPSPKPTRIVGSPKVFQTSFRVGKSMLGRVIGVYLLLGLNGAGNLFTFSNFFKDIEDIGPNILSKGSSEG
jgi:hypothetical protein